MALTVGIFSRSAEEEYAWLLVLLRGRFNVFAFYISNTNQSAFRESAGQCQVAILYHSKTRGRINIVDVTDSIYDKELAHLSATLGKDGVIVVVDDVDDSSVPARDSILRNQPSINRLAAGAFLFTAADKHNGPVLERKAEAIIKIISAADKSISSLVPGRRSPKLLSMNLFTWVLFFYNPDRKHAFIALFWTFLSVRNFYYGGSKALIPFVNPKRNDQVVDFSYLSSAGLLIFSLYVKNPAWFSTWSRRLRTRF